MCNCYEETKEKLLNKISDDISNETGFQEISTSYFENEMLISLDGGLRMAPFTFPFIVEYKRKAKTSGKVRTYKRKIYVNPSHCPICGERKASSSESEKNDEQPG